MFFEESTGHGSDGRKKKAIDEESYLGQLCMARLSATHESVLGLGTSQLLLRGGVCRRRVADIG